jgi:3-dehydroquinate synthase
MQIIDNDIRVLVGGESLLQLNSILEKEYKDAKTFVLVDENTLEHCFPLLVEFVPGLNEAEVIEIESGEESKSMEMVTQLCQTLIELGADRKSLLVNLGGGVITDLGGFVASVYKRGIDFINIPTSLLAQVDASVGGKVGVDLGELKNQIGVFNHANCVAVDPQFLATLSEQQLFSGYAEMLKHALIADENHWKRLMKVDFDDPKSMAGLLYESVMIKYNVVVSDYKEAGDRKKLNFGHTIGHAIESFLMKRGTPIFHGEAVACGMLCEAYISKKNNGLSEADLEQILKVICTVYHKIEFSSGDYHHLIELMKTDKKNENNEINFSLLTTIGDSSVNHYPDIEMITEALGYYQENYRGWQLN